MYPVAMDVRLFLLLAATCASGGALHPYLSPEQQARNRFITQAGSLADTQCVCVCVCV